jgi:hypothetical protein
VNFQRFGVFPWPHFQGCISPHLLCGGVFETSAFIPRWHRWPPAETWACSKSVVMSRCLLLSKHHMSEPQPCVQTCGTEYRHIRVGEPRCSACRQERYGCCKQFSLLRNDPVFCFQVGPLSARIQYWWNNSCLPLYRRVSYKCKDKGQSLGSRCNLMESDAWLHRRY